MIREREGGWLMKGEAVIPGCKRGRSIISNEGGSFMDQRCHSPQSSTSALRDANILSYLRGAGGLAGS